MGPSSCAALWSLMRTTKENIVRGLPPSSPATNHQLTLRAVVGRFKNEVPIQINSCSLYSIGEAPGEDAKGEPPSLQVLWVAGQGGWFEVNPAPAYQLMHRKIREAIKLYYTIYDIYDTFGAQTLNRHSKTSNTSDPIERLAPVFLQVCSPQTITACRLTDQYVL